ncbi:MAG: sigma 54-interacting transcriptional regulator [Myxococcales bacterium]|nr:sigma 54-interacting transcriptional regulator [Myxococcales bacterium]
MNHAGPILWLSDRKAELPRPFVHVTGRDGAAERLNQEEIWAICLDRADLEQTRADARWLRRRRNRLPVFAVVATAEIGRAVQLLTEGVEEIVMRGNETHARVVARLRARSCPGPEAGEIQGFEHVVAESPAMRACRELVRKAQASDATVLLQGETGTGKELVARAIHLGSARSAHAFVPLNCAAFPETLLESELFGYLPGAFTGATRGKRGHFEEASLGTLFLDEIGDTSPSFQVKMLRALQEGRVRPLGSTRERPVDVRVIAATNCDLFSMIEAGSFRRDLYYRLHVFPIELPPLRGRIEDIVPLAEHFLLKQREPNTLRGIGPDAACLLETYAWPGNVRELENEIARLVANARGEPEVTARMLSETIQGLGPALPVDPGMESLRETMARFESWVLRRALERHAGRRIATARSLGITRECLYKKLRRYEMQDPRGTRADV